MSDHIKIRPATGIWSVRAGGAVLGESERALELSDGDHAPVIFFPREDIATEFLDRSETRTANPRIGDASYFSIVTKSTTLRDAVLSYENPNPGSEAIAGHLAFATGDLVTVEEI